MIGKEYWLRGHIVGKVIEVMLLVFVNIKFGVIDLILLIFLIFHFQFYLPIK